MKKEEYAFEPHQFVFWKAGGKSYCVKCGLIALTNDFSRWAADKGCNNELHQSYKSVKHKHTKLPGEA